MGRIGFSCRRRGRHAAGDEEDASALASIDCQERDEDKRILLHTMRKDELQGRKRKKVEHEEKSKAECGSRASHTSHLASTNAGRRAQELSVLAEEGYLPRKDESLVPQFSQTASPGLSKSLRVAKPIEELFQRFLPPEFYEELRQCLQEVQDLHPGERHTPITLPVVQQYVAAEVELMAQNPTAMVHYFKAKEEQGIKGFGRSTFMRVRGLFQHLTTRDQTRLRDAARAATAGLVEIGDRVSFDERLKRFNPRASDTDSVVRTIRDKPTGRGLLVYSANVLLLPPVKASDHQKQTRETYPMIIWYNQVLLRDQRAPAEFIRRATKELKEDFQLARPVFVADSAFSSDRSRRLLRADNTLYVCSIKGDHFGGAASFLTSAMRVGQHRMWSTKHGEIIVATKPKPRNPGQDVTQFTITNAYSIPDMAVCSCSTFPVGVVERVYEVCTLEQLQLLTGSAGNIPPSNGKLYQKGTDHACRNVEGSRSVREDRQACGRPRRPQPSSVLVWNRPYAAGNWMRGLENNYREEES